MPVATSPSPLSAIVARLDLAATEINTLERQARHLLYTAGDTTGYTEHLRQKAILLSSLIDDLEGLEDLPHQVQSLVQERVGSFSYEAERALRVDSVFYMSVLLYPEGHRDGAPNELEEFVGRLRALLKLG